MPKMRNQLASALIVTCLCLVIGCSRQIGSEAEEMGQKESKSGTISVTIDFDDQRPIISFTEVAMHDGETILDVLQQIESVSEGKPFRFDYRGAGETAFLESIMDVKNEGGNGRNWMYKVNGEAGKTSFAVHKLKVGDAVRWKFKKYEEEQ